jgi:hypothetical protein
VIEASSMAARINSGKRFWGWGNGIAKAVKLLYLRGLKHFEHHVD